MYLNPLETKLSNAFQDFIDENDWVVGSELPKKIEFSLTTQSLTQKGKTMATTEVKSENLEVEGAVARELSAISEEILANGECTIKLDGNTVMVVRQKPKKAAKEEAEPAKKAPAKKGKAEEEETPKKKTAKKKTVEDFDPTDIEEFDECEDLDAIKAWAEANDIEYVEASGDELTLKRIRKAAVKFFE